MRPRARRRRARHERPGAAAEDRPPWPHRRCSARTSRCCSTRSAGLLAAVLGNAATNARRPRRLRRAAPTAATRSCCRRRRRRARPRERVRAGRQDLLRRQRGRPDARGRRPHGPAAAEDDLLPVRRASTTACGSPTTAAPCTSPTSATRPTAVRRRRAADPRRQPRSRTARPNPRSVLSTLTWPERLDPAGRRAVHPRRAPVPPRGRRVRRPLTLDGGVRPRPSSPVGAARIINIDDPRHPTWSPTSGSRCTSPRRARGSRQNDPGA